MSWYNLISFAGIFIFLGFAWVLSTNRKNMNWHVIVWGVGLMIVFGLFVFVFLQKVPDRFNPFLILNNIVLLVMNSATEGIRFVFGPLADPSKSGFILAVQAFPTIIFFSALIAVLYYTGIMNWVIKGFAFVFTRLMRTSGAESLVAASNIFVGVEAAIVVKPYLSAMTKSELCTLLTTGMASIASSVFAAYVFALKDTFPTIAAHLISASILSAPAALVLSKIVLPEDGTPVTLGKHITPHYEKENNIFEAIINGAGAGLQLIFGIVALLIAVLGLVALIDLFLKGAGGHINKLFSLSFDWSIKGMLGYVFYPFTLIMGVPIQDALPIAKIIGERVVVTEFTSYIDLAALLQTRTLVYPARSAIVAAYALCGFAHVASMAIFIGGTAALAPEKMKELTQVGVRALIAATLACFLTACIAGMFYTEGSLLFGK